jgi:DNA-binding transcriptional regulator YiaG
VGYPRHIDFCEIIAPVNAPPDISMLLAALSELLSGNLSPVLDAIERADPGLPLGDAFKAGIEFARARASDAPLPDEAKGLLTLLAAAPVARQCFRTLREGFGITQQEIAEKCRVTVFTVSHWETGTTSLPEEAIVALFDTLASRAAPPAFTGIEIARFRQALHMRQVDLAAAIGVSVPTVKNWERRGNSPIPVSAAQRVHDYAAREGIDLAKLAA